METDRSLPVKSRTGFLSHRKCIDDGYEYPNELVKQGVKNPRMVYTSGVSRGGALDAQAPPLRHHFNIQTLAARLGSLTTIGGVKRVGVGLARERKNGRGTYASKLSAY